MCKDINRKKRCQENKNTVDVPSIYLCSEDFAEWVCQSLFIGKIECVFNGGHK